MSDNCVDIIDFINFTLFQSQVKSVRMSRRGRLSDQQLAMTLEEDSGGEDDTTKEQWVEDGDDIDKKVGRTRVFGLWNWVTERTTTLMRLLRLKRW